MINHARTLLLNVSAGTAGDLELGSEYIPASFMPLSLPGQIEQVRRILFGATPDMAMRNYRARQLLTLLHNTDLEQMLLDLDPRITYDFSDNPFSDRNLYTPIVEQLVGGSKQLAYVGEPIIPDSRGIMRMQWLVTIESGSTVETRLLTPLQSAISAYTITGGISDLVPLVGSLSSVRFQTPATGDVWRVTVLSRPQADLGQLLASLRQLGPEVISYLFATTLPIGKTEPYITLRNLWDDHHELGMQLGALVTAMIYRTNLLLEAN